VARRRLGGVEEAYAVARVMFVGLGVAVLRLESTPRSCGLRV
jgi:hypothetical protein